MSRFKNLLAATFAAAFATACGDPGAPDATATTTAPSGQDQVDVAAEAATPLLEEGWNEIEPGGETLCSDGSPYKLFARPGNPKKLVVYFQGGGACWNRENCDLTKSPTYVPTIGAFHPSNNDGIFDFENGANPLRDYSFVFAPYCTGDIHLGDSDTVYDPIAEDQAPLTIHHRGRTNAQAALDLAKTEFGDAVEVFVTGSSAGSVAAAYYAPKIADIFPNARITQLGDAAGGYRNREVAEGKIAHNTHGNWGSAAILAADPLYAGIDFGVFGFEHLYTAASKAYPHIRFAQYDTVEDWAQKSFLAAANDPTVSLADYLAANHADITAVDANFRSFIAGGDRHTILRGADFYQIAVGDVSFRDWVADLAEGRDIQNVVCEDCAVSEFVGAPLPASVRRLWIDWEDASKQAVAPFKIFDNLYYVGIDWVAAYVLETSDGLILIDALYGKWAETIIPKIRALGLNPADIKYIIATHGHFDHAGGADLLQRLTGARVVMAEEDWAMAEAPADHPLFAFRAPGRDMIAKDGDVIELGDTQVALFKTPGHTEGVLTLRYQVRDGDETHMAITLGGVGLNFSGVERTEAYIASYNRLLSLQEGVAANLPNHEGMGRVFELRDALAARAPGAPHPFVNEAAFRATLETLIVNAEEKLAAEKAGTAMDPLEVLTNTVGD